MILFSAISFSCILCDNGSVILNYYNCTSDKRHKNTTSDTSKNASNFFNLLSSKAVQPSCLQFQLYTSGYICLDTFHTSVLWDSNTVTQFNQYTTECIHDTYGNLLTTLCDYGSPECFSPDRICSFERDIYGNPAHCTDTGHLRFCRLHKCPDAFKCHESYCIAIHMVCDMVLDCPDGEDEYECDSLNTRGMFRYYNIVVRRLPDYMFTIIYNK